MCGIPQLGSIYLLLFRIVQKQVCFLEIRDKFNNTIRIKRLYLKKWKQAAKLLVLSGV
jgi:hypothetical protein